MGHGRAGTSEMRVFEERAETDVRLQFLALSHDMFEIVDSDLFSEVCLGFRV